MAKAGSLMTKADKILEQLHALKKQAIADNGRTEVVLAHPNESVTEAITEAGGVIGHEMWEQWCRSNNCPCNSHNTGQSLTFVEVSPEWLLSDTAGEDVHAVFAVDTDPDVVNPIMIIPSDPPQLVWTLCEAHWARRTRLAQLR